MKKTNVVLLSVLFAAISLTASSAFAAETGTLTISGTVSAVLEMEIYDAANSGATTTYTTLNLATGNASTTIANIHEKCNDPDGYTMNLTALSGTVGLGTKSYLLAGDAANASKVAYTLTYGGSEVVFASGLDELTNTTAVNVGFPSFTNKALVITIVDSVELATPNTGAILMNNLSILPADTYTDTLTFTIASKA